MTEQIVYVVYYSASYPDEGDHYEQLIGVFDSIDGALATVQAEHDRVYLTGYGLNNYRVYELPMNKVFEYDLTGEGPERLELGFDSGCYDSKVIVQNRPDKA